MPRFEEGQILQWTKEKEQTMIYNTLQRKTKTKKNELVFCSSGLLHQVSEMSIHI